MLFVLSLFWELCRVMGQEERDEREPSALIDKDKIEMGGRIGARSPLRRRFEHLSPNPLARFKQRRVAIRCPKRRRGNKARTRITHHAATGLPLIIGTRVSESDMEHSIPAAQLYFCFFEAARFHVCRFYREPVESLKHTGAVSACVPERAAGRIVCT